MVKVAKSPVGLKLGYIRTQYPKIKLHESDFFTSMSSKFSDEYPTKYSVLKLIQIPSFGTGSGHSVLEPATCFMERVTG